MVAAVVFDMDGVIVDTESAWDAARRDVAARAGRPWPEEATRAMQGMSSVEWSAYMRDTIGIDAEPAAISDEVVDALSATLRESLPLLDGAVETVNGVADRVPIALASSANRPIIDLVLDRAGIAGRFGATVSSEEVPRGKPAPDVYLEAARRLGVDPTRCGAVEDSSNGLRSAAAAGMTVFAYPNAHFPPDPDALALAAATLEALPQLLSEL
jgi:HAD superfamily hydrolase (TIGR01509 family)